MLSPSKSPSKSAGTWSTAVASNSTVSSMGVESPCQGSRCPTTRWVRPRWWLVAYRRKSLGLEFLDEDPAPEFLLGNVGGDSDSSSGGDLTELEDDEDDDVDDDDNEEFELERAVLDILGGDSMTNDNLAPVALLRNPAGAGGEADIERLSS
jgi:hypothetical protein